MTTLDSAARSRKAARAVLEDALGVFPSFSSSTCIMLAEPNSYRRGAVDDQPLRALSQDFQEAVLQKEGASISLTN